MKELYELFMIFARIGGLTFGGGYAMLPLLQKEVVEQRGWVTEEELLDYYAIGQCTPGIIAVNTATFIGYKRKKTLGAIIATLGVCFPSVVIITVIAMFLRNIMDRPFVIHAFAGIRICVCALIISAVAKLVKKAVIDLPTLLLFLAAIGVSISTEISPVFIIVGAAVISLVIRMGRGNL